MPVAGRNGPKAVSQCEQISWNDACSLSRFGLGQKRSPWLNQCHSAIPLCQARVSVVHSLYWIGGCSRSVQGSGYPRALCFLLGTVLLWNTLRLIANRGRQYTVGLLEPPGMLRHDTLLRVQYRGHVQYARCCPVPHSLVCSSKRGRTGYPNGIVACFRQRSLHSCCVAVEF